MITEEEHQSDPNQSVLLDIMRQVVSENPWEKEEDYKRRLFPIWRKKVEERGPEAVNEVWEYSYDEGIWRFWDR